MPRRWLKQNLPTHQQLHEHLGVGEETGSGQLIKLVSKENRRPGFVAFEPPIGCWCSCGWVVYWLVADSNADVGGCTACSFLARPCADLRGVGVVQ